MNPSDQVPDSLLEQALEQLQSAIALLDCAGAPGQIAAHIDLAVNQLRDIVSPHKAHSVACKLATKIVKQSPHYG